MSKRTAWIFTILSMAGAGVCVLGAVLPQIMPGWARLGPVFWYTGGLLEGAALCALLSQWIDLGIRGESQQVMSPAHGPPEDLESVDGLIERYAYVHYGGQRPAFATEGELLLVRPSGASDCLWMLPTRNSDWSASHPAYHLIQFNEPVGCEPV
jgi:hypothetical protein